MSLSATQASGTSTQQTRGEQLRSGRSFSLWIILTVGAGLRLIALGHKSFWLDEIASVAISRRPQAFFWHFLWHDEGNMALYYVLLKPWLHFGYSEAVVRLLSVIAGVLSVGLMYLLGERLFGRQAGILSAAFLAINACAIAVSQEARAYSFVVLLVLLSTYVFTKFIEQPTYSRAVAYALVAGLTCYFHYFGVLVPAAHATSMVALPERYRRWKPMLAAWAIIAVLASPILWLIHAQDVGHISWLQPPSWLELYHLGVFLAADGGKAIGAILLALELVLAACFIAAFGRTWRGGDVLLRWRYALAASAVVTPIALTLLVSIVRPAFYHRFLIICLPGWLLMLVVGVMQLRSPELRNTAIVAVSAISLAATIVMYRHTTEDWRGAVKYLIANTHPEDRVFYYQSVGQFAGDSYREWLEPSNLPKPASTGINPTNGAWQGDIGNARRVWLVLYRAKSDDAEARGVSQVLTEQYHSVANKDFTGIAVVEYIRK